ncbi:hypothetical protein BH18ACI5_BH18ACI5_17280 [soil metagenome]
MSAATSSDVAWAGPLAPLHPLADAFIELARPKTLLGRIAGLRTVPFNVAVANQTAGGAYSWVGQGKPAPVTSAAFATVTASPTKAAAIIVVTEELVRLSTPPAERLLRDELVNGLAQYLDTQFVDPAVAAVAGVSPASVTNGTTAIVSAGTSQANAATDLQALITQFVAANPDVEDMTLLVKPANAVAIARATNSQTLGLNGGSVYGIPVVTSANVGDRLIALDASRILVADENEIEVDASRNALVEMETAPTDPGTASTVQISLY